MAVRVENKMRLCFLYLIFFYQGSWQWKLWKWNKLTSLDGKDTVALFIWALTASSFMDKNCREQVISILNIYKKILHGTRDNIPPLDTVEIGYNLLSHQGLMLSR